MAKRSKSSIVAKSFITITEAGVNVRLVHLYDFGGHEDEPLLRVLHQLTIFRLGSGKRGVQTNNQGNARSKREGHKK